MKKVNYYETLAEDEHLLAQLTCAESTHSGE